MRPPACHIYCYYEKWLQTYDGGQHNAATRSSKTSMITVALLPFHAVFSFFFFFFMVHLQQCSTGCKTEGTIIERSRPYHISLDGTFPPSPPSLHYIYTYIYIYIFFSFLDLFIIQGRQCTVHGCENGNNLMQQIKWIN